MGQMKAVLAQMVPDITVIDLFANAPAGNPKGGRLEHSGKPERQCRGSFSAPACRRPQSIGHLDRTMPLTRLNDEYLEQNGVRFVMTDEDGNMVPCRVSHEALRDHADRLHLPGTDAQVFEAYRELIEQIASDAYDAEGPFDDDGRVRVTSEALARVMRSA